MTKKKNPLANLVFKAVPQTRVLLHKNGTAVKIGDETVSFRGEAATVTGWKHDGQNKMYVKWPDGSTGEYFPSVFEMTWGN